MRTSSQNRILSSIPSIMLVILAYLIIPTCSIPIQSMALDLSDNLNTNNTSSNDGVEIQSSPNRMEVMNWILAAISIVIVVELIFWLFKCVNMVRKGIPGNEDDGARNNNGPRGFDATSNGLDDEYLPPYDGLSLPKYCEAMEVNNGQLRSSHLSEDENSTTNIVTGQGDNNEGHDEGMEEISRPNNQTSTVVVEMNQVSKIVNIVEDGTGGLSSTEETSD